MNERRMRITGLHHITLLVADAERSLGFYRNVLGMRLVQQTVNDDDPERAPFHLRRRRRAARHPDHLSRISRPRRGQGWPGSTHHFALAVESEAELAAWSEYLQEKGIPTTDVMDRTEFKSIYLRDPDGHIVEIAA